MFKPKSHCASSVTRPITVLHSLGRVYSFLLNQTYIEYVNVQFRLSTAEAQFQPHCSGNQIGVQTQSHIEWYIEDVYLSLIKEVDHVIVELLLEGLVTGDLWILLADQHRMKGLFCPLEQYRRVNTGKYAGIYNITGTFSFIRIFATGKNCCNRFYVSPLRP